MDFFDSPEGLADFRRDQTIMILLYWIVVSLVFVFLDWSNHRLEYIPIWFVLSVFPVVAFIALWIEFPAHYELVARLYGSIFLAGLFILFVFVVGLVFWDFQITLTQSAIMTTVLKCTVGIGFLGMLMFKSLGYPSRTYPFLRIHKQ